MEQALAREIALATAVIEKKKYRKLEEFIADMKRKYGDTASRSDFNETDVRELHKRVKRGAPELLVIFPKVKTVPTREQVWARAQTQYPGMTFNQISKKNGRLARLIKNHGLKDRLPKLPSGGSDKTPTAALPL